MAIIKDGKLVNTPEDNMLVNAYLKQSPKMNLYNEDTGEYCGTLPCAESMSGFKWQLLCLKSRLDHQEKYARIENVSEVIADLKAWLKNYIAEHDVSLTDSDLQIINY